MRLLNRTAMLAALGFVLLLVNNAWGQENLLTNPGFETGDLTGWTVSGTSPNYGVNTAGFVITGTDPQLSTASVIVHSGTYAGYTLVCTFCGQPPGTYLELSQTLSLTPGGVYTASFWVGNGSSDVFGESDQILVNGHQLQVTTRPNQLNPGEYGLVSANFTATQPVNTISFLVDGSGTGTTGFSFDDFSLVFDSFAPSTGGYVYLLDWFNNKVASYQLNQYSGTLIPGTNSPFDTGASPVFAENSGPLVYVADQGSSQVSAYLTNFNNGMMVPILGSPFDAGLTPNAIGIDRALHLLYVSGRDSHGNGAIAGWNYSPVTGVLSPLAGSPFLAGISPHNMAFDRNGRHLYAVDANNQQLLAFSIDPGTGALTAVAGSPYQTGFAPEAIITNTLGNYLYVTNSGDENVSGYRIAGDGTLTPISGSPFPTGMTPVSLAFDLSQRFLYALNEDSNNISAFHVDGTTGSLSLITGSPFATGQMPLTLASQQGFLYANTAAGVSAFQIDRSSGSLSEIPGSPLPYFGTAFGINVGGAGTAH